MSVKTGNKDKLLSVLKKKYDLPDLKLLEYSRLAKTGLGIKTWTGYRFKDIIDEITNVIEKLKSDDERIEKDESGSHLLKTVKADVFDNLDVKKSTPNEKTFSNLNLHDSKTSNDINLCSIAAQSQPKGLNDANCSICKFDLDTNIYTAYCGHRYHLQCFRQHLRLNKYCPQCK